MSSVPGPALKTKATKVLFRVTDGEGEINVETLWAVALGDDQYMLDNSLFYAYGVSWQDIVFAPFDSQEGIPTFQAVVSKSGHRTIRVIFDTPTELGNSFDQILQGLIEIGCSYEGANPMFLSINIPPAVELQAVCVHLIEHDMQWEHADPIYASR